MKCPHPRPALPSPHRPALLLQVSRILTSRVRFGFINTQAKKDGLFVYKYDSAVDHTTRKVGGPGPGARARGPCLPWQCPASHTQADPHLRRAVKEDAPCPRVFAPAGPPQV